MKSLFMTEYRRAEAAGEPLPKAVIKMGHWHLFKGTDPPRSRRWETSSPRSRRVTRRRPRLAVYLVGTPEEFRSIAKVAWLKPLADAVPSDRSTVVDLRALRGLAYSRAGAFLDPQLRRAIFGFDFAICLARARPATREWAQKSLTR
jgi:hypothetical protein